ncbi:Uncharacterised protein [uncultured archaeon]|nr:Uncharacterised protein [uncultured archaeon]
MAKIQRKSARAQNALEFLMSYSWAVAILLASVAIFFYLGVMRPQSFAPNTCSLPQGLSCDGYKIANGGNLTLRIRQETGYDIKITRAACNESNMTTADIIPDIFIPNGGFANVSGTPPAGIPPCRRSDGSAPKTGDFYSGKLIIEFRESQTGISNLAV